MLRGTCVDIDGCLLSLTGEPESSPAADDFNQSP